MNLRILLAKHRIALVLGLTLLLLSLIMATGYADPQVSALGGTVTYYGSVAGDHQLSVALFPGPVAVGSPLASGDWPGRSVNYTFSGGPPGTVYVSAFFDANDSGGPPDPGEPVAWYDGNGDGEPDPVVLGAAPVGGIDIAVGDIIYVDAGAGGGNDGSCWQDAYVDLQSALGAASSGAEIWIAEGVYKPTATTSRTATFQLKSGVGLYGGFDGTELLRNRRDWRAHPTILSGDIGTQNVATDNSHHVVTGSGVNNTARIDGLVITAGYAEIPGTHDKGGGLYISGGSPVVANVNFIKNYAVNHGSGMATQIAGSTPLVINSTFSGNWTNFNGAMANLFSANPTVVNTTFAGNTGNNAGAIVNLESGASVMRNVIMWNNGSREILLHNGGVIDIQYSTIAGVTVYAGTGNSNADPLFVDADGPDNVYGTLDDDLRLLAGSPAIDAGNNDAVPADASDMDGNGNSSETAPIDMAGGPRFADTPVTDSGNGPAPIVDMGAFERLNYVYLPSIIR